MSLGRSVEITGRSVGPSQVNVLVTQKEGWSPVCPTCATATAGNVPVHSQPRAEGGSAGGHHTVSCVSSLRQILFLFVLASKTCLFTVQAANSG